MRKFVFAIIALMLLSAPFAFANHAAGPDAAREAHRQQLIEERKARGPEVRAEHANTEKGNAFWKREGERSGLGNSGERMGTFFSSLNPVPFFKNQEQKYNERKGTAKSK